MNFSPSTPSLFTQIDHQLPLSASSKASRQDHQDVDSILIYLESLSAWLNGYFFSRLSLDNSQLPLPPRLDNQDLLDVCNSLRLSIANVREKAIKNLQNQEKLKEIPEKVKASPQFRSKTSRTEVEDRKINCLIDSALKDANKRGFSASLKKTNLVEKVEELCNCLQSAVNESIAHKMRLNDLEGQPDFNKTRRTEEFTNLNRSKSDQESSMAQVIYPLVSRVNSLQEKKQFYSLLFRHYERFIKHEEEEIRKLLETSKNKSKKRLSFKSSALCVFAAVCIRKLPLGEEKVTLKGLKVKLVDFSLVPNKTLTMKSLPAVVGAIHKAVGGSFKQRGTLNSLISASISTFQKFMNDVRTILAILLKNNAEQKEVVQSLTANIKDLEEERDELEGALTRTVEYTKNLEEEIMEYTENPEVLRQIAEDTEMSLELESHKKALKGLTSQYNQLEHRMDNLNREYEELKKEFDVKCRRIQELEGKRN
jgi:chromosome segregation ATPase